ncbi:GMC oxidoreductase [Cadophora sp. MPI-SDFR-AT-0126]|nr:GMC oxidoreductase [Leotiomycetes sp. MPI-SDFR-AT-0126]
MLLTHLYCLGLLRSTTARLLGSSFGIPSYDIFNPSPNATFDFVVVGAGNAGLPLAVRLAEAGFRVALVEAGSYASIGNGNFSQVPLYASAFQSTSPSSPRNPQTDWGQLTEPQAGTERIYPQGKALGGSTSRGHQAYTFGTTSSYDQWAEMVNDVSYSFKNFRQWLHKPLNFTRPVLGHPENSSLLFAPDLESVRSGPVSITFGNHIWPWSSSMKNAFLQAGIPKSLNGFTSGSLIGSGWQLMTVDSENFTKESSETSYLQKLGIKNNNLVVYANTLATRVIFDTDKRAVGVLVDFSGVLLTLLVGREVVLSAGAFRTPQLLMLSGIGPHDTLREHGIPLISELAGVGQNLGDHVAIGIAREVAVATTAELQWNEKYAQAALADYHSNRPKGPFTTYAGDLLAFEKLPPRFLHRLSPSARQALDALPPDWPHLEHVALSLYGGPSHGFIGSPDGQNWATLATAIVSPFSRGNVTINSTDPHVNPIVNPAYFSDERDIELAIQAFRRVQDILNQTSLANVLVGMKSFPPPSMIKTDEDVSKYVQIAATSLFQASGTAKMGRKNETMAVLDSNARVFGVSSLRVVDASSLPLLMPSHIQATMYGLAEKIADDMLKDAKKSHGHSKFHDDGAGQQPMMSDRNI